MVRRIGQLAAVITAAVALIAIAAGVAGRGGSADADIPETDPWHEVDTIDEPPFASDEVRSLPTGGSTYPVSFRVGPGGEVRLRGIASFEGAAATDAGTYITPLFTLGCGYRPASNIVVPVAAMHDGELSSALVQVASTGEVALLADASIVSNASSTPTVTAIVAIDGVRFEPEPVECE